MSKFRKKPVVIEAEQFVPDVVIASPWMLDAVNSGIVTFSGGAAHIQTLEGTMTAQPNDWIIKGVQGELYPCKPDIFAATYEPAE